MGGTSRKNSVFANPFYVCLMVASTLFVITVLGYLIAPYVLKEGQVPAVGQVPPSASSRALATWIDRNGPLILGAEFVVMLITGVLAMITDDWFSKARASKSPPRGGDA